MVKDGGEVIVVVSYDVLVFGGFLFLGNDEVVVVVGSDYWKLCCI